MRISVIGLGKLGCPLAAWLSSKGHEVIGVDANLVTVQTVSDGKAPVEEPGLQELMDKYPFPATTDTQGAVVDTDATFIIVPTPSGEDGMFQLRYVTAAAQQIGLALKKKKQYHLVVIVSTVMPGHTDEIAGVLEVFSLRICGTDFGLCYNPEFIALGSVLHGLEYPDFVLIGESDELAGDRLQAIYYEALYREKQAHRSERAYVVDEPKICRMSFVNAEIAKLALNCYVTMKISFANALGMIVEEVEGANSDTILQAIGNDSRIGKKYLRAGVGFGGPCFPRDAKAMRAWAVSDTEDLLNATIAINRWSFFHLCRVVDSWSTPESKIGVLGIAYKPGTAVTEESHGKKLVDYLGVRALPYDSFAHFTYPLELDYVLEKSDVLVVMLPLPEFANLDTKAKVVIDPWRHVQSVPNGTKLIQLGRYNE